ncbi:hypothetical protein AALC25_17790 [Lachnospiraceae bacterium 29-84]
MDKYENKLKLDHLNQLVQEKKYKTAVEIADSINWKKIKEVSALRLIGEVYERGGRLALAKEIYLWAYDRAGIGKNFLYRLTLISLKMKDLEEAKEFYQGFLDAAPNDPTKHILRYLIATKGKEPLQTRIQILEEFKKADYVEEWALELAYLYREAKEFERCVELCDELILWFGEGEYVEKALELKMLIQPLDEIQQEKYEQFKAEKWKKTGGALKEATPPVEEGGFDNEELKKALAKNVKKTFGKDQGHSGRNRENIKDMVDGFIRPKTSRQFRKQDEPEVLPEESLGKETGREKDQGHRWERDTEGRKHLGTEEPKEKEGYQDSVRGPETIQEEEIDPYYITEDDFEELRESIRETLRELWYQLMQIKEQQEQVLGSIQNGELRFGSGEAMQHIHGLMERITAIEQELRAVSEELQAEYGVSGVLEEGYGQEDGIAQPDPGQAVWEPQEQAGYAEDRLTAEESRDNTLEEPPNIEEGAYLAGVPEGTEPEEEKDNPYPDGMMPEEHNRSEMPEEEEGNPYPEVMAPGEHNRSEMPVEEAPNIEESAYPARFQEEQDGILAEGTNPGSRREGLPEEEKANPYLDGMISEEYNRNEILEEEEGNPYPDATSSTEDGIPIEEPPVVEEEARPVGSNGGFLDEQRPLARGVAYPRTTGSKAPEGQVELPEERIMSLIKDREVLDELGERLSENKIIPFFQDNPVDEGDNSKQQDWDSDDLARKIESQLGQDMIEGEKPDAEKNLESALKAARHSREKGFFEPEIKVTMEEPGNGELDEEQLRIFSYFVPVSGMKQQICQALEGIYQRKRDDRSSSCGNLIIMGGKGSGKTVLATDFIRAIKKSGRNPNGKVGKITGDTLNQKELSQLLKKVAGGYLIIERAGEITRETAIRLGLLMDQDTDGLLVIIEDSRKEIEKVLSRDINFANKFTERIKIPIFNSDELVEFARAYAAEQGCEIEAVGELALHNRISGIQKIDEATTLTEVKDIMDEAIINAKRGGLKKIFGRKKFNPEGYLYLREKDFEE